MSEKLKKCRFCGRIITDKNNKIGLCPKHQKGMNTIAEILAGVAITTFGVLKVIKK